MKKNEINKIGYYILLVNIALILYLLSNNDSLVTNFYLACFSSVIAILLNTYYVIKLKKKKINGITLILNIIIMIVLVIYGINKII